jgi:Reverse transcriptase (RNA-dependent DNA polymerase)
VEFAIRILENTVTWLYHYGIRGQCLDYIKCQLSNRYQYVSISNQISTLQPIDQGLPQGSILGPLLFLLYINI